MARRGACRTGPAARLAVRISYRTVCSPSRRARSSSPTGIAIRAGRCGGYCGSDAVQLLRFQIVAEAVYESHFGRRMPLWGGEVSNRWRSARKRSVSLPNLPQSGLSSSAPVSYIPCRSIPIHARQTGGLPVLVSGNSQLLRPLRVAPHVPQRWGTRSNRRNDLQPRQPRSLSADSSCMGRPQDCLVARC